MSSPPHLVIRASQMVALGAIVMPVYVQQVAAHLTRHFPGRCVELGPDLNPFIERGIERARKHGLSSQRDVCRFVGVLCALGQDLDEAPNLGWARELLRMEGVEPALRLDLLVATAVEELGRRDREVPR